MARTQFEAYEERTVAIKEIANAINRLVDAVENISKSPKSQKSTIKAVPY